MYIDYQKSSIRTVRKAARFIRNNLLLLVVSAAVIIPGSKVGVFDNDIWNSYALQAVGLTGADDQEMERAVDISELINPQGHGYAFVGAETLPNEQLEDGVPVASGETARHSASEGAAKSTDIVIVDPLKLSKFSQNRTSAADEPVQLASVSNYGVSAIVDDSPTFVDTPLIRWTEYVVRRNDTLSKVFQRNGVDRKIAFALVRNNEAKLLHKIYPGDTFNFAKDAKGNLLGIELRRRKNKVLMIYFGDGSPDVIAPDEAKQVGSLHAFLQNVYQAKGPDEKESIEEIIPQLPDLSEMDLVWHDVTVRRGDTLSHIFNRLGLSRVEAITVANASKGNWLTSGLRPRQQIRIATSKEGKFVALEISHYDSITVRTVILHENDYLSGTREMESEVQEHHACATIKSNVYSAAKTVKMSTKVVDEYTDLFASRIDFSRQLQRGDEMCVLYEQTYVRKTPVESPRIIAASLRQKNNYIQAYRVKYDTGRIEYYDQNGVNMRGHFLRSPIKSARVTSVFTNNRFHPILKVNRKHLGVDYGARSGTPVRATSNGYVVKRKYNRGYGKFIVLRHGAKYETLYAHLSRYAKGSAVGSYVEQGQVIGYVGSTGLSTGPHLHYEFRVNGVHRDPLGYNMPQGEKIAESAREAFSKIVEKLSARLASIEKPMLVYTPREPAEELAKE